jgi:hypothetical protein
MTQLSSSAMKGLGASRKLDSELAVEKYLQDLERIKLEREFKGLS